MTKDTEEFSQFTESVASGEYTLPRDDKSADPKGWIRGNTKIGPVLEVKTSYLQGKHGVENRIESVNKDNSHSWVRISHGLNKLVTDLNNKEYDDDDEQQTSETKTEVFAFASRSKAEAKPGRPTSAVSYTVYGIVSICGNGLATVDAFGVVPLRRTFPFFFILLLRADDSHLVHGPGGHYVPSARA